jgi:hypothetical protein
MKIANLPLNIGQLDIADLGEGGGIPFVAKKLRHPKLLWLNERWFLEHSVNIFDETIRKEIVAALLDEFAYSVPQPRDASWQYCEDITKVFVADRYGGHGIARNGGSGRCGVSGAYQVKGIGRTGLVDGNAGRFHGHGRLSLEEALREVVYSELTHAEFPHGSVPTIAVIETGTRLYWSDADMFGEPCALAIRPFVLRLSHFERATLFNPGYFSKHHHLDDVERTRRAIATFLNDPARLPATPTEALLDIAEKVAEQIAFGHVHRLFHGPYVSSGLSTRGELVDFGNYRSLPNWECATVTTVGEPFGLEMKSLYSMIESLHFHFTKFAAGYAEKDADPLKDAATKAYHSRRNDELSKFAGQNPSTSDRAAVIAELNAYWKAQQQHRHDYNREPASFDREWIYRDWLRRLWEVDKIPGARPSSVTSPQGRHAVDSLALPSASPASDTDRISTLARLLRPRDRVYRSTLQKWLYENLVRWPEGEHPASDEIQTGIRRQVSDSRRVWNGVPKTHYIVGQVSLLHSSALFCRDIQTGQPGLFLEGYLINQDIQLLSEIVPLEDARPFLIDTQGNRVQALVPVESGYRGEATVIHVGPSQLSVPQMAFRYVTTRRPFDLSVGF